MRRRSPEPNPRHRARGAKTTQSHPRRRSSSTSPSSLQMPVGRAPWACVLRDISASRQRREATRDQARLGPNDTPWGCHRLSPLPKSRIWPLGAVWHPRCYSPHPTLRSLDLALRSGGADVRPSEKESTAHDKDRLIVDQLLMKLRRATPAPLRRTSAPAAAPQAAVSSVERAISYPTGTVGVVGTVGTVGAVGTSGQLLRRPAAMRTMRSSRAVGIWARAILA